MTATHAELELAEPYATGVLEGDAAAAFENHLIDCERCQTEVRLTAALRRELRDVPTTGVTRGNRRWVWGGAALLAAGIAAVMFLPRPGREMAALGSVTAPPPYVGMRVRALPRTGDSLFAAAMAAYVARDYSAASSGLRAALAAGADSVPSTFFLASAELMTGAADRAAEHYGIVIAAGQRASGYLAEAHLYRARALLRLGRGADALADLAAVPTEDRAVRAAAMFLADSVTWVMRR